ncbi:universal stress protein [Cytophagales bacterium LB-30]|uniref:Universal stress protein n=1 Tax=Shiella aurantiaca TaxID=3058365 RepID=A0ABT8F272_9BACT|nr:universal stress protein [Shiella aurantiaca]MDN4164334.1 universal stress protein [Shiella aurantiaca]
MYPIKRILIGLDISDLDLTLINFASFMNHSSTTEEIYFVNIVKNLDVPEEVLKEFPNLIKNAVDERMKIMRDKVEKHIDPLALPKVKFIVKKGQIAKQVLKISQEKDIDLIVMGRREKSIESGLLSQRLARRASCSLLIVPEGTTPELKRILVPSDFSDYSTIAMEEAVDIAFRNEGEVELVVQNVYKVPVGYHYTGKTFEEFAEVMRKHAEEDYKNFIAKIDTKGVKIDVQYSLDEDEDPVEDIIKKAEEIEANGIIIGAKGRTATTAFFLGSMAERLIQLDSKFPLLVVRPKGQNAGIMDLIKEL